MRILDKKPSSKMKQYRGKGRRPSSLLYSSLRIFILVMVAIAVPFLIVYSLPSIKFLLFEVFPSLWSFYYQLATPRNLFLLLNLIIFSIFAITHLHRQPPSPSSSSSSRRPSPTRSHDHDQHGHTDYAANDTTVQEEIKVTADHGSAALQYNAVMKFTDHYDAGDNDQELQSYNTAIKEVMIRENVTLQQHAEERDSGKEAASADSIQEAMAGAAAVESKKAVPSTSESSEANPGSHARKSSNDHNSRLAGNFIDRPLPFDGNFSLNIDSIISAEESIFKRAQDRPLPSARFSTHKKAGKLAITERSDSPLKISRPTVKRGDTLDATWKAICEKKSSHASPLIRHHNYTRKTDNHGANDGISKARLSPLSPLSPTKQRSHMLNSSPDHSARVIRRREPSMLQEELNARVESFISKFNEQIRIQREQSLLNYMQMVDRGAS